MDECTKPSDASQSSVPSDAIRAQLIYGFGDYHTSIQEQIVLVDQLIEAVRQEERERCAAIVDASEGTRGSPID